MPFFPNDYTVENLISSGLTGCVYAASDSEVIKVPLDIEQRREIEIEKIIYERLTEDGFQHPNLLEYHGSESFDKGDAWALRLQRVEGDQLAKYLLPGNASEGWRWAEKKWATQRFKWANQITEALSYVHSKGVVHCDLGTHNIMVVQKDSNIKLIDFGGSSIDCSQPLVSCCTRNRAPWFNETGATEKTDIFALGSVLYSIMNGQSPYYDRLNGEIPALYGRYEFPLSFRRSRYGYDCPLDEVIQGCWRGSYKSAHDVLADIQAVIRKEVGSKERHEILIGDFGV